MYSDGLYLRDQQGKPSMTKSKNVIVTALIPIANC
jgi:hypothetical protein